MSDIYNLRLIDVGFSAAVRRAGRAAVAAKRHNPEVEGKELAEYLRSDRPLGSAERNTLGELVVGNWRKKARNNIECEFDVAASRAARALRYTENRNPEIEGEPLAKYLRSNFPLGPAEREMLAELVVGNWRRHPFGKIVAAGQESVKEIVVEYRRLVSEGLPKTITKMDTAKFFKISVSKVEKYIKLIEDREAALQKASYQ